MACDENNRAAEGTANTGRFYLNGLGARSSLDLPVMEKVQMIVEILANRCWNRIWIRRICLYVLLPIFLCTEISALKPGISFDCYRQHRWDSVKGLPSDKVTCISQDMNGFIWLGTDRGLVRFNGIDFEVFNTENTEEMRCNYITCLFAGDDGKLLAGTHGGGFLEYNPTYKKFKSYFHKYGTSIQFISSLCQDKRMNTWIGTEGGGLLQWKESVFFIYTTKDGFSSNHIDHLAVDAKGCLWVGTPEGLHRFENGNVTVFKENAGLLNRQITALCRGSNHTLWVGTPAGIHRFRVKDNRVIDIMTSPQNIRSLLEDSDGILWAAAETGLFQIIPKSMGESDEVKTFSNIIKPVSTVDEYEYRSPFTALFEDSLKIVWCGTMGEGFACLKNSNFSFYNKDSGLSSDRISSIQEDKWGNIWIGTWGGGVNRYTDGKFFVITQQNGLSSPYINTLCEDKKGILWVGTLKGLNRLQSVSQAESFCPGAPEVGNSSITAICNPRSDLTNQLWVGVEGKGLYSLKDGRFYRKSGLPFFSNTTIRSMAEDDYSHLWVGTDQGLRYYKNDALMPFAKEQELSGTIIYDILIDEIGIIWLGTNKGILRYDKSSERIGVYPDESELITASVYRVLENDMGSFWLSSNRGIFFIYKNIFDTPSYLRSRKKYPGYFHILESDGINTSVFSGGFQPAGCKTSLGHVWLPTFRGVIEFTAADVDMESPSVPVLIEKVVMDGKEFFIDTFSNMIFPHNTEKIEIYFSVIDMQFILDLKIKYQLDGNSPTKRFFEEKVIDAAVKKVEFQNLPGGRYHFILMAGSDDKGWNKTSSAALEFSIKHGFSIGEILIFILVIVGAILVFVVSKVVENRRKNQEIERIFGEDARYKTSSLHRKKVNKYMNEILNVMKEEKPYLDPEMSVSKMASRLGIPKEYISQIVNQRFYMNFNQFLNKYRVEEAKKLLLDPKESQFVVLKIGYDVGFNSKSTFNAAFKKFTGLSPSEYREKHEGQGDVNPGVK